MKSYTTEHTLADVTWAAQAEADSDDFTVTVTAADTATGLAVAEATVRGQVTALGDVRRTILESIDVLLGSAAQKTPLAAIRERHPQAYRP